MIRWMYYSLFNSDVVKITICIEYITDEGLFCFMKQAQNLMSSDLIYKKSIAISESQLKTHKKLDWKINKCHLKNYIKWLILFTKFIVYKIFVAIEISFKA